VSLLTIFRISFYLGGFDSCEEITQILIF